MCFLKISMPKYNFVSAIVVVVIIVIVTNFIFQLLFIAIIWCLSIVLFYFISLSIIFSLLVSLVLLLLYWFDHVQCMAWLGAIPSYELFEWYLLPLPARLQLIDKTVKG